MILSEKINPKMESSQKIFRDMTVASSRIALAHLQLHNPSAYFHSEEARKAFTQYVKELEEFVKCLDNINQAPVEDIF